jgi:hypothetical protein
MNEAKMETLTFNLSLSQLTERIKTDQTMERSKLVKQIFFSQLSVAFNCLIDGIENVQMIK